MLNGELFVIGGENKKNQVILKKYILLLIIYWECVYVPIIDVPKIVYFKQMIVQFLGMTVNFQSGSFPEILLGHYPNLRNFKFYLKS